MSSRRLRAPRFASCLSLLAIAIAAFSTALSAVAQDAGVVELQPSSTPDFPIVLGVSADGSVVFGQSLLRDTDTDDSLGLRPVRWNALGEPAALDVIGPDDFELSGKPAAASSDGRTLVGYCDAYSDAGVGLGRIAVRWNETGEVETLDGFEVDGQGRALAEATGVSADGATVCGFAKRYAGAGGAPLGQDAVVWNAEGSATALDPPWSSGSGYRDATGSSISANGLFVVGRAEKFVAGASKGYRPAKWNATTGSDLPLATVGVEPAGASFGEAIDVSADGSVAVGHALKWDAGGGLDGQFAVRWLGADDPVEIGMRLPAGPFSPVDETLVACSPGGDRALGQYSSATGTRGFLWSADEGAAIDLGTPFIDGDGESVGSVQPRAMSDDGLTVVGLAYDSAFTQHAFIWHAGEMRTLEDVLTEAGADLDGWDSLDDAIACSADGSVIVGTGRRDGAGVAFRAEIRRNATPTVASEEVVEGDTIFVRLGETFAADFVGQDADGESLRFEASGLPPSATLSFPSGTTSPSPFEVTLDFVPKAQDVGIWSSVVSFRDALDAEAKLAFDLVVPANSVPTIGAITPVTVECDGESNLVTLATTVGDADAHHRLNVVWRVAGQIEHVQPEVVPGSIVSFEHDYPHGASAVTVEVDDGFDTTSAGTSVTVRDTTAPTVIVATNVVVPTDPGKSFATNVFLPPPDVFDACDGDPHLRNNAPATFPLGTTTVIWTATDADGNSATGTQKVVVEDREPPKILAGGNVSVPVDRGEVFATVALPVPETVDNCPGAIDIAHDAPARFSIGTTRVTWTATDAAGNSATAFRDVTVVNAAPIADAGGDVTLVTASPSGIDVTLDGTQSSDPDGHDIRFAWSAANVRFDDATSSTPKARFPVGVTTAQFAVVDEAGRSASTSVKVAVTYDPGGSPPPGGARIIDGRDYGSSINYFVGEASWRCGALPQVEAANVYLLYAAYLAQYAYYYDLYAAGVTYESEAESDAALADYLGWRYWQLQCSYSTSSYLYYAFVFTSGPVYVYADYVTAAYDATFYATWYGIADFQAP